MFNSFRRWEMLIGAAGARLETLPALQPPSVWLTPPPRGDLPPPPGSSWSSPPSLRATERLSAHVQAGTRSISSQTDKKSQLVLSLNQTLEQEGHLESSSSLSRSALRNVLGPDPGEG